MAKQKFLPALIFLSATLLTGCTTVTRYEPKAEAGPARAKDYPIYLYPKEIRVPRPFEVVGFMTIRDTPVTVFGGSFEGEVEQLKKQARKVGAEAVQLTSVEQPDFLHAKYRMDANLIRFTDEWENVPLTEEEFAAYLAGKAAALDPIEGVWVASDAMQSRVAIMRSATKPGRDFIAFILKTQNPTWQRGDKKLDLSSGERPGVYRGVYYFDDYRRQGIAFTLRPPEGRAFILRLSDDSFPIVFTKE